MVTWHGGQGFRPTGIFGRRRHRGPFAPPLPRQIGLGKIKRKKRKSRKKQRGGGPAMMAMMAAPLLMPLLGKMLGQ